MQCRRALPAEVLVVAVSSEAAEPASEVRHPADHMRLATFRGVTSLRGPHRLPSLRPARSLPVAEHVLGT